MLELEKCLFDTSNFARNLSKNRKRRDLDISEWEYVVNYFTQEKLIRNGTKIAVSEEIDDFIAYVVEYLERSNWGKLVNLIPAVNQAVGFVRYLELPALISTIDNMTVSRHEKNILS